MLYNYATLSFLSYYLLCYYSFSYGCTLLLALHAIGCILAFIVMQNCHRKKKKLNKSGIILFKCPHAVLVDEDCFH